MQADVSNYGVGYWHVDHQLPAIHFCRTHQTPLLIATDKVSGQDRFGWLLPHQANFKNLQKNLTPKGDSEILAEGALALWRLPSTFTFSIDKLHKLYYNAFVLRAFSLKASPKSASKLFNQVLNDFIETNSLALTWPWLASTDNRCKLSTRLFRVLHPTNPRASHHPLIHLLLIALLFDSWGHFWTIYNTEESNQLDLEEFPFKKNGVSKQDACNTNEELKIAVIEEIRSGKSATQAAKMAGITVATAMTWAASEGISIHRRPKILNSDLRSSLVRQLQKGAEKSTIATSAKISMESVTRLLLTEPGLHAQWCAARFARTQRRSRSVWKGITDTFPTASSNEWRKLDPAVYAWLYRHDHAWLQSSIHNRPQTVARPALRRNWEARDKALAQAVQKAALELRISLPGKRLTIGIICANVDGLRRKMSVLAKLPLTRMAIQESCNNSSLGANQDKPRIT